uniref:Uncharacterized protein n=1 Tax=Haptolina ericina TaxID=156174 RepID=A0A7S3BTN3_9EUKA
MRQTPGAGSRMSAVSVDAQQHATLAQARVVRVRDCKSSLPVRLETLRSNRAAIASPAADVSEEIEQPDMLRFASSGPRFDEWGEYVEPWTETEDEFAFAEYAALDNADLPVMR